MASKAVSVDGNTKHDESSIPVAADTAAAGAWDSTSFTVTKGKKISVAGKLVEVMASAAWSYDKGKDASSGSPVPPVPDSATLMPGNTKLTDSGSHIFVDGDKATGSVDGKNDIVVKVTQSKLKTA